MSTKPEQGATPRPWKVGDRGGAGGVPILAGARFGYVLARISGYSTSDSKDEANAALIVKAVNAHDALVEALTLAKKEIRGLHDRLFPDGWIIYQTHSPEMKQINEAIAAAEQTETT